MKIRKTAPLVALVALAACSSSGNATPDAGPSEGGVDAGPDTDAGPVATQWTPVLENLEGALLSIWGSSADDIWTVGGALGNGGDAYVLRYDRKVWKRVRPGGTETYWWVHGTSANDVWLVGEKGRITHWDGTKFEEKTSGTTATLFGVWAAAPNDAWAVGGVPDSTTASNDVVLHWDGASWKPEELPEKKKATLFKVWGSSKDDVYVVGDVGIVWHRSNGTWKREAEGVARGRITTVTGCSANEVYAVGGRDLLARAADGTWTRSSALLVNDVNGIACVPDGTSVPSWGRVVVVGGGSLKLRLVGSEWKDDFGSEPFVDLHAAWVDPSDGAFWGVGGKYLASPQAGAPRAGVIARFGPGAVPATLEK